MIQNWKQKIAGFLLSSVVVATMTATTVLAGQPMDSVVDYTKSDNIGIAEGPMARAVSYKAYCHKEWILNSKRIGVGAKGWTNLVSKKDGTYLYHYSNIRVYADSAESIFRQSGRKWGTGKVSASTGNVGLGAMHHHSIYYGIN